MKVYPKIRFFIGRLFLFAAAGILLLAASKAPFQQMTPTGITIPEGYRDWRALGVSYRLDKDEIRLILANDTAWNASAGNILPFPDGSIIAKLAYKAQKSGEWAQAVIPGEPQRVEFIVKNNRKYADTGGWGFGRFVQGKPAGDKALYSTCFPCHKANVKDHDFVFTRLAR
jgi:hypothetical protein